MDAVYHSHLLEHLRADEARAFLGECWRVLKPGGVLRIAVPDLEGIARAYLTELEWARGGQGTALYDWTVLELTDQLTRESSGGRMVTFLRSASREDLSRVRARAGAAVVAIADAGHGQRGRCWPGWRKVWRRLRLEAGCVVLQCLGGGVWARAFRAGMFRQSGEVHRQMYDEVSLSHLLRAVGFVSPRRMRAGESSMPGFDGYALEIYQGEVRKPDSLFIESIKPSVGHGETLA